MLKAVQYTISKTKAAQGKRVLVLPEKPLVSFPFLKNVNADAVLIGADEIIESILFNPPQKIDQTILTYSSNFHISGDLLAREIAFSNKRQCFTIHLSQPVEFQTELLGTFKIRALEVNTASEVIGIIKLSN
ncbi:hypothetical protein NO1_1532 [Candidatus Termititenax aidoneus]|uniref:Uncharacterized protein n=1 Tax=Termititenax aidoneus TaxID=2218524 RepID=A0A388TCU5_TERA1|nr:hypothetical protein NO1_1532 [Candidatus Termititenax aidoneus]